MTQYCVKLLLFKIIYVTIYRGENCEIVYNYWTGFKKKCISTNKCSKRTLNICEYRDGWFYGRNLLMLMGGVSAFSFICGLFRLCSHVFILITSSVFSVDLIFSGDVELICCVHHRSVMLKPLKRDNRKINFQEYDREWKWNNLFPKQISLTIQFMKLFLQRRKKCT